jgi:hypothetical protein
MWSWILDAMGLLCTYLVGRKWWWGWLAFQGYNLTWVAYAIVTRQWGFLPGCCVYALLNQRNLISWRREAGENRT